jgi:hypothetical protein
MEDNMETEKRYLTKEEAQAYYAEYAAVNMRFILAKLPSATPKHLAMLAAVIRGMGIEGCAEEYVPRK